MSDTVTLYQLAPSPNSIKVRLALGLKRVPHQVIDTSPDDDARVIEVSGQPLRPVLVHGARVVWDSHAILRYIETTWPRAPRLFSADAGEMHAIEEWEDHARNEVGLAIGMMFDQLFAPQVDPAAVQRANEVFAAGCAKVEAALAGSPYVMGQAPNAADVTLAAWVVCGLLEPASARDFVGSFFAKHLQLPRAGFDRTRAWCREVMALDGRR